MILDFQLNTLCFAVYKPYEMLKWFCITMCMTLTLKQGDLAFVGEKSKHVPAGKKEH